MKVVIYGERISTQLTEISSLKFSELTLRPRKQSVKTSMRIFREVPWILHASCVNGCTGQLRNAGKIRIFSNQEKLILRDSRFVSFLELPEIYLFLLNYCLCYLILKSCYQSKLHLCIISWMKFNFNVYLFILAINKVKQTRLNVLLFFNIK